jgi:hypothetical protein
MIAVARLSGVRGMSERESSTLPQVTFYTKAGCHLCEDARDMLDDIAAQTQYELTEIDIRSNPDIFELYRYRIPVVIFNETIVAEGRIEYSELARAFNIQ